MIDTGLEPVGTGVLADQIEACQHTVVEAENRLLRLAATWADHHPGEGVVDTGLRGRETPRQLGGEGTPTVAGFAPAEFGALVGTSTGAADRFVADALDLRHRLPRLWRRVHASTVRAWQARRVAACTRHLSPEAAAQVDTAVAEPINTLPWARFENLLYAAILAADPDGAARLAEQADAERFVRAGRANGHGLKLLVAKAGAGDVTWFLATVDRIAAILAADGDPDPVDIRRSKAIGILAQPALALKMLYDNARTTEAPPSPEPTAADPATPTETPTPEQTAPAQTAPEDRTAPEEPTTPDDPAAPDQATGAAADPAPPPRSPNDPPGPADQPGEPDPARRSLVLHHPPVDPDACRPRAVVYVHLSEETLRNDDGDGVARVENCGPILLNRLRRLLGDHCDITLQPILDLADDRPVDGYETPPRIRETLHLRNPVDIFPYGVNLGRKQDLDHTIAYISIDDGGPPGQTRAGGLGKMVRFHHRVKTHGHWHLRQPEPGTYLWRSPHGRIYLVNTTGTHPLGKGPLAQAIWNASAANKGQSPCEPPRDVWRRHSLGRMISSWHVPRRIRWSCGSALSGWLLK